MRKRDKILLLCVFILSVFLRFAYLYQLKSTPVFGFFAADTDFYDRAMENGFRADPRFIKLLSDKGSR